MFLLLNSLQKKFENFLQSISLKKISKIFQKIRKKILAQKKGENATFFPVKSDTTLHWVLIIARSVAKNFGRSRSRSAVAAAPQPQAFQIIHKVKKNWKNILKYIFKLEY